MVNYMLGSLDLRNLVKELKVIETARINKIYHDKNKFSFKIHTKNGDFFLNIVLPGLLFKSEKTKYSKETPSSAAMTLRKYLENAVITSISQVKSERIIKIACQKAETFSLIIELFNKGNVILVKDNKILTLATSVKSAGRELRHNSEYVSQEAQFDFLNSKKEDFIQKLKNSQKESIVLSLATDLGLGGHYSEEICQRAGIDKSEKCSNETALKAFSAFQDMLKEDSKPRIIERMAKAPLLCSYEMNIFKDERIHAFSTISEAIDAILKMDVPVPANPEVEKLRIILAQQEESIKKLESEIEEDKRKGELIYENYGFLKEILDTIEERKKKMHLKEILDILAKHPKVKKADAKTQKLTLDL